MPSPITAAGLAGLIESAGHLLLVTHVNPDGDTLGAALALRAHLRGVGKRVEVHNESGVPYNLGFLPGSGEVSPALPERADLTIAFDNGSALQFGKAFAARWESLGPVAVVDHHVTPINFGHHHLVDAKRASTGELALDIVKALAPGAPLAADVALCVYAAIVVDTGGFRYSNTGPEALAAASECLAAGVDPWEVTLNLYENQPIERVRVFARAMETLEVAADGRFAHVTVTEEMLAATGATEDMLDGLINQPRSIRGVEVSALFKERGDLWKVSFRSKGAVDVSRIALRFGGGGHHNAAGCRIPGDGPGVKRAVAEAVAEALAALPPVGGRARAPSPPSMG